MERSTRTGLILMISTAVCFGFSDIGVKVLGENLSPWQITGGRGVLGLTAALVAARFNYRIFMVKQWPWHLLLGLSGTLGFLFFILSLKYLPLSIALPLGYVYPAVGALLSPLINREKPGREDWIAIALALGAVVCLSHGGATAPTAGADVPLGLAYGLIGAFFVGLMTNLARRQTRTSLLVVNLFYVYLTNLTVCLPLVLLLDTPILPAAPDLARLFFFIAPISILGYGLMLMAYRYLNAHRGGIVMTLEAATAAAYGVIVLDEPLSISIILGGVFMVLSGAAILRSSVG